MRRMKGLSFLVVLFLVSVFLVDCATTEPIVSTPPPGAVVAQAPTQLVVGSTFTFRETNVRKKTGETYTLVVEKKELYNNKPAYWIRVDSGMGDAAKVGNYYEIYDLDLSMVAVFEKGKEKYTYSPCVNRLQWPLFVGKEWKIKYRFDDKVSGRWVEDMIGKGKVENYEQTKVPAGTFEVFKIVSNVRQTEATVANYYSPAIGMWVKEEISRSSQHPSGSGKWVRELIQYNIPK